jgi:hypothetical protein
VKHSFLGLLVAVIATATPVSRLAGSSQAVAPRPQDYGLLQSKADSDERRGPIDALERQAPQLAKA